LAQVCLSLSHRKMKPLLLNIPIHSLFLVTHVDSMRPTPPWALDLKQVLNQDLLVPHTSQLERLRGLWQKGRVFKEGRPKLAVLIVGLADRLMLATKIKHVIEPLAASGWDVELFISVVGMGQGSKVAWVHVPHSLSALSVEHFEVVDVIQALAERGKWTLRYCDLDSGVPDVMASIPIHSRPPRLWQYPPPEDETGLNVLRRFKAIEFLMKQVQAAERNGNFTYDFLLLTKDDDHWLGPLDMGSFFRDANHVHRVYSKNCLVWDGINDGTLLFGRQAAEAVLPRLFRDFWMQRPELETYNSEGFWKGILQVRQVDSTPVDFARLPTCNSAYVPGMDGKSHLCLKRRYMCEGLPTTEAFEHPHFCTQPSATAPQLRGTTLMAIVTTTMLLM